VWYGYNHGTGVITQRQIAHILSDLGIRPTAVGPRRLQGYRAKDFVDAFARYHKGPGDPLISSGGRKKKKRSRVRGKKKRSRVRGKK
jgi:hypothetical protein